MTLVGEDGAAGRFAAPSTGNTYTSPAIFHASLLSSPSSSACSGSAFSLTWKYDFGEVMCLDSSGLIMRERPRRQRHRLLLLRLRPGTEGGHVHAQQSVLPDQDGHHVLHRSYLSGLSQSGGLVIAVLIGIRIAIRY